jgi:hypothetical protein
MIALNINSSGAQPARILPISTNFASTLIRIILKCQYVCSVRKVMENKIKIVGYGMTKDLLEC